MADKVISDLAQQIRGVALRMNSSGVVLSLDKPARHHDIIRAVGEWANKELTAGEFEQGFLLMTGRFIRRAPAARLMGRDGLLFSEDLW